MEQQSWAVERPANGRYKNNSQDHTLCQEPAARTFPEIAKVTSHEVGRARGGFALALATVLIWAVTGPSSMIYEGSHFVIRAGLGRNKWTLLIHYPDNADGNPTVYSSADRAMTQSPQRANELTDG